MKTDQEIDAQVMRMRDYIQMSLADWAKRHDQWGNDGISDPAGTAQRQYANMLCRLDELCKIFGVEGRKR